MLRIGVKKELLLWKREKSFSLDLFKGLILALGFHLLILFGLKISSPPNLETCALITPVSVEIDLSMPLMLPPPTHITLSPIEQIKPPPLLEIPPTTLIVEAPISRKVRIHEPDFTEIEKIAYKFLDDLEEEKEDD